MNKRKAIPSSLLDVSQFRDQGIRLLIVEDNEADFQLIGHHLEQQGIQCVTHQVQDLHQLKACLAHEEWHVVISDHTLPGFGAEETLRLVRNLGLDIPFIIVSGTIDEHKAAQAMRAGADDYVLKNNLTRLGPTIERALRVAQEQRNLQTAEFEHRELQKRLNTLTEVLDGFMFVLHQDLKHGALTFSWVSEGSLKLLGLPPKTITDNPNELFNHIHTPDRKALIQQLYAPQEKPPLYWEGQLRQAHPDTPPRWISICAQYSPMPQGQVWEGVLQDITEKKQAEAHLRQAQHEYLRLHQAMEARREQERKEIAQEIHDDMGSSLIQLKANITQLKKRLSNTPLSEPKIEDMNHLVDELLRCSQRIAQNLRPSVLDLGLVAAMQWQVRNFQRHTHIQADFSCNRDEIHIDSSEKTCLFRILQEALTNIVKHAQATQVDVELFDAEDNISLEIRDNGKGILPHDKLKPMSLGLQGMHDRVSAHQGWIEINSATGLGTTVMVMLPKTPYTQREVHHD